MAVERQWPDAAHADRSAHGRTGGGVETQQGVERFRQFGQGHAQAGGHGVRGDALLFVCVWKGWRGP